MPFAITGWEALSVAQKTVVFGTTILSAAVLAVSLVGQMSPGSRHRLDPAGLPIAILALLLLDIAAAFRPQSDAAFIGRSFSCLRSGLTYSLFAAIVFLSMARNGAMLVPALTGATVGGLAGLTGFTVLETNCPNQNVFHILAGHWGVIVISLGAGAALGVAADYVHGLRANRNPRPL